MTIKHAALPICILTTSLILSACASMNPAAEKRAYCNTLKSKMVFSGSTSITRQANIEMADEPLEQRNFDADGCDN